MQNLARIPIFAIGVLAVAAAFTALWLYAGSDIVHGTKGGGKAAPVELLLIDKDTLDDRIQSILSISDADPFCGTGTGDPIICVNDDIAKPGERTLLFTRRNDITPFGPLTLPTAEHHSYIGLFRFSLPDPQLNLSSNTEFTIYEFITATVAAADASNLDQVAGVVPLNRYDIEGGNGKDGLLGKTVCAVVFDENITVDTVSSSGNLAGANLGVTAFEVTALGDDEFPILPSLIVNLLPSTEVQKVCESVTQGKYAGKDGGGKGGGGKGKPAKGLSRNN